MPRKPCYWTRKLELELVEIVRQREFIWKPVGNTNHHIQQKYKAYAEFAANLGRGFTARSVRDRWVNIRSTFNHNLRRVDKSRDTASSPSEVYVPSWPLWRPLQFLQTIKHDNNHYDIDENSEIATDTVDFENNNTALEENDREENSNAADEIIENRVQELTETSSSTFTVSSKLATKKRGKSNKRQDEVHEAIDKTNKIAENVTKNTTSLLQNKEDEFDIFGRYTASTLRTLPDEFSIIAKTDIRKALSEIQLKAVRQQTQSSLSSTSNIYDPENPGYLSSASVSHLSNYEDDFNNISFTNI